VPKIWQFSAFSHHLYIKLLHQNKFQAKFSLSYWKEKNTKYRAQRTIRTGTSDRGKQK